MKTKEEQREYARLYYIKNRDRLLEYSKQYDKEHPERKREYRKKYYLEKEKDRRQHPEVKKKIKQRQKIYRQNHQAKIRERNRNRYQELRIKFFEMYGNSCTCCGESEPAFLSLEHKQGQPIGRKNKENTMQSTIRALSEYRPDLFEVLCHNCNQAQKFGNPCPHKTGSCKPK